MGQKLSSKLLFIYSPNSDGFYIFYISQGSVATQLRCDDMFSNQFITNFPLNAPVEKFWESVNIWQTYGQKFAAYFLGHPVYDGSGREEWQAWKIGTGGKGGKETERAKERWEGGGKSPLLQFLDPSPSIVHFVAISVPLYRAIKKLL